MQQQIFYLFISVPIERETTRLATFTEGNSKRAFIKFILPTLKIEHCCCFLVCKFQSRYVLKLLSSRHSQQDNSENAVNANPVFFSELT